MNVRQSLLGQAVLIAGTVIYDAILAPTLPSRVPTHWGMSGRPDAYGSPAFSLWFGPCMIVFLMLLTVSLPKISPEKFKMDRFEDTYGLMMFVVSLLMTVMHFVILTATSGKPMDLLKVMMVVLGLFFSLMGNFMGKVKRNYFMGVRTPWTLSSERVWDATHRRAAILWFFGGLVIALTSLAGLPFAANLTIMMVIALWPVLDSYRLYRRLEG